MALHAYEHKTQYYETDQMGIIHHSNYIRWFEEARTDLLRQMGISYEELEAQGILCPVHDPFRRDRPDHPDPKVLQWDQDDDRIFGDR